MQHPPRILCVRDAICVAIMRSQVYIESAFGETVKRERSSFLLSRSQEGVSTNGASEVGKLAVHTSTTLRNF